MKPDKKDVVRESNELTILMHQTLSFYNSEQWNQINWQQIWKKTTAHDKTNNHGYWFSFKHLVKITRHQSCKASWFLVYDQLTNGLT